jgi:uncharacterized protein (DUF58 family)
MEFDEVREYMPGDDVRSIDWNVTARFGHPYIKKYVEERELTVFLLVDVSASGDFGSTGRSKRRQCAELAALLAFSAIRNNDQVGLLLFSSVPELFIPPRKGRRHGLRLVRDLLAHERSSRGTCLAAALEHLMRVTRRRAVVFVISDFLDSGYERPLSVAARRHDVVAMRVTDPHDLNLTVGGNLVVEDAESGEIALFGSGSAERRQRFALEAGGMRVAQEQVCLRAGVDLIDITVGQDYVPPLMRFFRGRARRR